MTVSRHIVLTALLLLSAFCGLQAQNTAKQESRKAALEKEIAQLQQQLKDNAAKSLNALEELTLTRRKISARKELLAESEKEIKTIDDTIRVKKAQTDALKARLDTMTVYYQRLVRNAYKNRDARVWYIYLLSSKNFNQASRRYNYLKDLSSQMNEQASKMKELKAELDVELARLADLRQQAEQLRAARQKDLDSLRSEEATENNLVAKLKKNKLLYQKQINTKTKQVQALNNEIQRIIAQYVAESKKSSSSGKASGSKKSGTTASKPSKPVDYKLSGQFEANKGKLPWPASGPVVEKFGRHNHPVYTNLSMPFNNGINIAVSKGAEVKAVFDGEVRRVIVMPGYNKCVLVQHGNYFTFYCKLGQVNVKAGDKVSTGQTIGRVDTIDGQTQLHFQVWNGSTPQNPELWLRP